jgi:hypothetical protein
VTGFEPAISGAENQRNIHYATQAQNQCLKCLDNHLEVLGIDPRTFRMQSEHSTTELHPRLVFKVHRHSTS